MILYFPVIHFRDGRRFRRIRMSLLGLPDRDQPFGMVIWHGSIQHRIKHAEDGAVGADPQPERQNDHGEEARTLPKLAQGVTKVLSKSSHHQCQSPIRSAARPWDRPSRHGAPECSWPANQRW